jgi:hypothetical protein
MYRSYNRRNNCIICHVRDKIFQPGALIGFAGPRVVRDTRVKIYPGFQTSEFLEHGFLDFITPRKEIKAQDQLYIDLIKTNDIDSITIRCNSIRKFKIFFYTCFKFIHKTNLLMFIFKLQ